MSTSFTPPPPQWTVKDALETYSVHRWGRDYFSINEQGHLIVTPPSGSIDVKVLVDDLNRRGIQLPLLIRFSNLLDARISLLNTAFANAIEAYEYDNVYRGVYPIKVNQARKVVEEITRFGQKFHYGLEAGSKPELLAVMAMLNDPEALVICNGYKDADYIETALLASKLDRNVVIVVEKPSELTLIADISKRTGIKPQIGLRIRPTSRGAGKWEQSGGDHAKFGLTASEVLTAVESLKERGLIDCFRLLHFHLGSQITAIRSVKDALREASRMYTELVKLGCSALDHFDVGGGLGVDYDGSQTNFESSMNYSVQEYANDVVSAIQDACDAEQLSHPVLVSESGRAVVAHHSVLVVNVIGTTSTSSDSDPPAPDQDEHDLVHNLWEVYDIVKRKNLRECFHDALAYKEQVLQAFNLGQLTLMARARCERIFWAACRRMASIVETLPRIPKELESLERLLCETYFCNFSMFQSLPDAWAVDQLFPIMPIHRLGERPTRRGVLADITCDSDGTIDSFIDLRDVKHTLALHPVDDKDYYLGIMLTGAYQEILGDLHNLFGDTNIVHVLVTNHDRYEIDEVVPGDTVSDVLRYVDYSSEDLMKRLRSNIEKAVRKDRMTLDESRKLVHHYREGLASYTYLE